MLAFLNFLAVLWGFSAQGPVQPVQGEAHEILAQLSDLRLDKNQIHSIRDITLRRDVISLSFERGAMAFLEPVQGRVTGAIFVGSGDVLVIPPDDAERRQLNKFTGSPILNEKFSAALLRFTDDTFEEILRVLEDRAVDDVRSDELEALLPWDQNLGEVSLLQNFRILTDFLGTDEVPLFSGLLNGDSLGWFDVVFDQMHAEEVVVSATEAGPMPDIPDIWASFNKRSEARDPEGAAGVDSRVVDVGSYDIDTTIGFDGGLRSTAVVSLRPLRTGVRVLNFDLMRSLRISEVRLQGRPVSFFQHPVDESLPNYGGLNNFVVVLPRPTVTGAELMLEISYEGQALEPRGRGIFLVNERTHWYPHSGFVDSALFDLTFHYPANSTLVATGLRVQELETEGVRHSRWTSDQELFVAGFNYGDFSVASDEFGALPIDVYVNNDVAALFQELQFARGDQDPADLRIFLGVDPVDPDQTDLDPNIGPDLYSRQQVTTNILRSVRSITDAFSDAFGPYPFQRLSVSQFPLDFAQGWPTLLYLSTPPFLDQGQSDALGIGGSRPSTSAEFVRASEIAHQWFGQKVTWGSYRDQWLIEGLANYAGVLYLEGQYPGGGVASDTLRGLRNRLLTSTSDATLQDDNGPIWLGHRLASSDVPDGYVETIRTKSAWVMHMLRNLMSESGEPDDSSDSLTLFLQFVRRLLAEHDGGLVSTWDFKAAAERSMTDRMDLRGDGTLDWFFDQWVFGTGVPRYQLEYEVQESLDGFVVSGRAIESEGLGFVMPVPVYSQFGTDAPAYLGDVVVDGNEGEFFFYMDARPSDLLLDPYDTILRKP